MTLTSPLPPGTQIDNYAEITDATDENNDPQVDDDSVYDALYDQKRRQTYTPGEELVNDKQSQVGDQEYQE